MNAIELITEIPGPRSLELAERKRRVVGRAASEAYVPVFVERGSGARVTDVDGNTFLDFAGGIGCLNVGHSHPRVVTAIRDAAERFSHTDFTLLAYAQYVELAERLLARTPIGGDKRAFFFNSGAEAIENAIKLARSYTGRPAAIAFEGGFHGRTYMAMSLTSKPHPYKTRFGPFASEIYRAPFPSSLEHGEEASELALAALRQVLKLHVAPETVAAIVIEPVQGEGGFVVAPAAFLAGVRALCDEHGVVLVADEVQSGFGRTGTLFAMEQMGVEPDLITVAKSIAAGLPLSGVLGRAEIMDAPGDSEIGGTFVGNPIACSAALAVLDVIEEEGLLERSKLIGSRLRERFVEAASASSGILEVRGLGAMIGVEFGTRDETGAVHRDPELATAVASEALAGGVILLKAGVAGNVIRTLVPLVISDSELEEALDVIVAAIESAGRERLDSD